MTAVRNPAIRRQQAARGATRPPGEARFWYIVAGVTISLVFVLPLVWEVFRSFQPESAISSARRRRQSFGHLTFENYRTLLSGQDDILRNVVNSLIVAVSRPP